MNNENMMQELSDKELEQVVGGAGVKVTKSKVHAKASAHQSHTAKLSTYDHCDSSSSIDATTSIAEICYF